MKFVTWLIETTGLALESLKNAIFLTAAVVYLAEHQYTLTYLLQGIVNTIRGF